MLGKGDQLFKFSRKISYPGMEDVTQKSLVETSSINVEFLGNKIGEITLGHT